MHSTRLIFLDNLRSFALLLGLIFHASIVYSDTVGYAIKSPITSIVFDHFCYFIHSFRMPLFFFLSGYFSELVWNRKGWKSYLVSRTNRLVLPFLVGIVFFAPIQYYVMYLNKSGKLANLSYLEFYFDSWNRGLDGLSHLWFLQYLIIYCIILVGFSKIRETAFFKKLPNWAIVLKYSIATFVISIVTNIFFLKGNKFFHIDPFLFFFYLSFFLSGIFAYKSRLLFGGASLSHTPKLILLILSILALNLFRLIEISDPLWMSPIWGKEWIRIYHLSLATITAWMFIYFFIEIFREFANWETSITIYLKESSLPIYLIHHPISLVLGYLLIPLSISIYLKFAIHTSLVFLFSFWIYDSLIKTSPTVKKLMGMK